MRPSSDPKHWTFLVDAEEDPRLVSHVGDQYDVSNCPEIWKGIEGPAADTKPARDRWGWWLSGYAPIRNRHGKTVAVLGVDMSASEVSYQERKVISAVAVAGLLLLMISSLLARRLSSAFSGPITKLAEATQRVAAGDLEAEVAVGGSHEIATLGRTFNAMTHALREHNARMTQLGNTDFLTSLYNHRYFQERLEQELGRATRYHHPLSLLLLDIDHFRQVNVLHGHQGGDDLLLQVSQLIKGALRECDIATRYGGEEFAIVFPETTAEEAFGAAERVRARVEERQFEIRSLGVKQTIHLTISGGLAEYPRDSKEKGGLVLAADVALLRAKHMLRNRICRFAEDDVWPTGGMDPAELHWALQDASIAAVESLAQALDARDHSTRGHSESVTRIAVAIAQALGCRKTSRERCGWRGCSTTLERSAFRTGCCSSRRACRRRSGNSCGPTRPSARTSSPKLRCWRISSPSSSAITNDTMGAATRAPWPGRPFPLRRASWPSPTPMTQ